MKKVLLNASVASMIYKFNMENIEILSNLGCNVDVACNFGKENPISSEEINKFREILKSKGIRTYETDCPRSIVAFAKMFKTYKQIKKIISQGGYEIIHTQSPIGGVLCRLAAKNTRKQGKKIIYTAHGFHFYKGAPLKNWIFYPIEKICSRYCDLIITINKEDYDLAKRFNTVEVEYIPGVGVDISRFKNCNISKKLKRRELNVDQNAFVLLSVGELSSRKNHQIIIKAIAKLKNKNILYLIVGKGEDYDYYLRLAKDLDVAEQIRLLGVRTDVEELCAMSDVFVHPSVREGLGIAPLEGMAAGLPLIASYVNGIKDYALDGVTGICIKDPFDEDEFANAIRRMISDDKFREYTASKNRIIAERFSLESSKNEMERIYKSLLEEKGAINKKQ